MPDQPDHAHLEHVRQTIRTCDAREDGTCPCGEKARRVVWRGHEVCRCYPLADNVTLRIDVVDGEVVRVRG